MLIARFSFRFPSQPGKPGKLVQWASSFPVREMSGNLRKVLQIREKSGNCIMFTCRKEKVVVQSAAFFITEWHIHWIIMIGHGGFWCENPSSSISRLVAVVNLTYTRITEFQNSSGKSQAKIKEFCFYEMLTRSTVLLVPLATGSVWNAGSPGCFL